MDDHSKDPDRKLLRNRKAIWTNDPEINLTEDELDGLMKYFKEPGKVNDSWVSVALGRQFLYFMTMVKDEKIRESDGLLKKPSKPSTTVKKETKNLREACEALERQLDELDSATLAWIDLHLKENGVKDGSGRRARLQDLKKGIFWPIDQLISAARSAEGISSRGPKNVALDEMVDQLAFCWEKYHGKPPVPDAARNQKYDPFQEMCKEMAKIADARLQKNDGRLTNLELTGIVPKVLKQRAARRGDS